MFKILTFPDPFLRKQLQPFDFSNPIMDPKELEQKMLETMYANDGIGLSANQIGIDARVFVMGHKNYPEAGQAFFNPIILQTVDQIEDLEEGCLSFPGVFVNIKRPKKILAKWQTVTGEWDQDEFDGYNCKCFCHELDHLEGIVFKDRISTLKWALAVKHKNKNRKK